MFTDGLNTLSSLNVKLDKKTHIVNSAVSANHNALKVMAEAIGGHYINLKQLSICLITDAWNHIFAPLSAEEQSPQTISSARNTNLLNGC